MRKTIFKWLILILLAVYACGMTIWAYNESRKNSCQGIEISITKGTSADTVTQRGVMEELSHYPRKLVGQPLEAIDTRHLETYLSRFSNFEDVECTVTTGGKLSINIQPMVPAIRVFDGDKSYYINKEGKVIESKPNFFVDVPVVVGNFSSSFTPMQVLPLVRFIERDKVMSKLVGMIEAKDPDNLILVPRIHGHVINFGDTNLLDYKRKALLTVYRKVMPYKGWNVYDTISVKFKGQVVATRRDKTRADFGMVKDDSPDMEEATLPVIAPGSLE
ncbi:MAG: hypothetical protein HDR88_13110 [Bacteroides sp.]|nr:hypothetical protein [Bacteroides sp.]